MFRARRQEFEISKSSQRLGRIRLHIAIEVLNSVTIRNEQFVLVSDITSHLVILTCDTNLQTLCRSDAELFADGIFKCCVNLHEPLHVIHASVDAHRMSLVFCSLTGKSEDVYEHILESICDRCTILGLVFQPVCVSI